MSNIFLFHLLFKILNQNDIIKIEFTQHIVSETIMLYTEHCKTQFYFLPKKIDKWTQWLIVSRPMCCQPPTSIDLLHCGHKNCVIPAQISICIFCKCSCWLRQYARTWNQRKATTDCHFRAKNWNHTHSFELLFDVGVLVKLCVFKDAQNKRQNMNFIV